MRPAAVGNNRRPRGYGLIEVTISSLLIVVALGLVVQTVGWLAAERRGAERRERATQEAANLMERLADRPWDELTPESARSLTLSEPAQAVLRDGTLEVAVASIAGPPSAKKITILVRWGDRDGGKAAPVRLVAWVHRREGGRP
jgi:Tfp pilus assembly protein PilV